MLSEDTPEIILTELPRALIDAYDAHNTWCDGYELKQKVVLLLECSWQVLILGTFFFDWLVSELYSGVNCFVSLL